MRNDFDLDPVNFLARDLYLFFFFVVFLLWIWVERNIHRRTTSQCWRLWLFWSIRIWRKTAEIYRKVSASSCTCGRPFDHDMDLNSTTTGKVDDEFHRRHLKVNAFRQQFSKGVRYLLRDRTIKIYGKGISGSTPVSHLNIDSADNVCINSTIIV